MQEQIGDEVERLIRLVQRVYGDFGLPFTAKLSTRPDEYLGEIATWDHAEAQLKARARSRRHGRTTSTRSDGAFYGPKIDFDITDAIGRKWQCATIQLDYQQPENFDLKYIGADNTEHRPVVIHRAIVGSFERFIAILIEHYAGAFPLVAGARAGRGAADFRPSSRPMRRRFATASRRRDCARCSTSARKRSDYKIREAQLQKVPYMLVVGDREADEAPWRSASDRAATSGSSTIEAFIDARATKSRARASRSAVSPQLSELTAGADC